MLSRIALVLAATAQPLPALAANEFDLYDAPYPGGTLQSQHDTLQAAIDAAGDGDEVRVSSSGSPYYQHAHVTGKSNLSIREEPGGSRPVIDGAYQPFTAVPNALWTDQGSNVWTATLPTASIPYRPAAYMNGAALFTHNSQAQFDASTLPSAFVDAGNQLLYVRTDGSDPNSTAVYVASKVSGRDVVLDVDSSSTGITVSGLTFKHGGIAAVRVEDSSGILLEDDWALEPGVVGFTTRGTASSDVTYRRLRVVDDYQVNWLFVGGQDGRKQNTTMERTGYEYTVTSGFLMEYCYAEKEFNGVNNQSDVTGFNDGSVIRRNHFKDINDDGIELDGRCDGCQVYENLVEDAATGISMAPKWGESQADDTFIYRNRIFATKTIRYQATTLEEGKGIKIASQVDASRGGQDLPSDWAAIYHNDFVVEEDVVRATYGTGTLPPSHFRFYDNVLVSLHGNVIRNPGSAADGNFWDGNLYQRMLPGQWYRDHYDGTSDFDVLPRKEVADATGGWDRHSEEARPDGRRVNQGVALPAGLPDTVSPVGAPDRGAVEKAPGVGITSVTPSSGAAGTRLHVLGAYLDETVSITVGGAPLTGLVFVSCNYAYGTVPSGTGTVDVVITKGNSTATLEDGYTYP